MTKGSETDRDIEQEDSGPATVFIKGQCNPHTDARVAIALAQARTIFTASRIPECNVTAITGNVPRAAFCKILTEAGLEVIDVDQLQAQDDPSNPEYREKADQLMAVFRGVAHRYRTHASIHMGSRSMSPDEAILHVAMCTEVGRELVPLHERVQAKTPSDEPKQHPLVAGIMKIVARVKAQLSRLG